MTSPDSSGGPTGSPRTRAAQRAGLTAVALTALVGSFLAGMGANAALMADGDNADRTTAGAPGPPPAGVAPSGPFSLAAFDTCEELREWYVDAARPLVGSYGWGDGPVYYESDAGTWDGLGIAGSDDSASAAAERSSAQPEVAGSETGTNVQEVGVDESDVAKAQGSLLVRVDGDELEVFDVAGNEPEQLGALFLSRSMLGTELLLDGDRAVVFGTTQAGSGDETFGAASTRVVHVDLADPANPAIVDDQTYDGTLLSARQYGETVRFVLDSGLPDLGFVEPGWFRDPEEAAARNEEILERSTVTDWLPTVRATDGGSPEALSTCAGVRHPRETTGAGTLTVVGYDLDTPESVETTAVIGSGGVVYSSTDRLYVATSPTYAMFPCCTDGPVAMSEPSGVMPEAGSTDLHAFELSGDRATYVASGSVEGTVKDRWSLDEYDGVLRVAVQDGPDFAPGSNSVVTFEEDDDELVEIGRIDDLGPGETIRSVRWFDETAIVVTFRQTDPLYAVDLTDPAAPRLEGELKIPGFSAYLHPVGGDRMLGIGQHADLSGNVRGAQAASFDLRDLNEPRRTDTLGLGAMTTAMAGADPRAFTWLPAERTALTLVSAANYEQPDNRVAVLQVGDDGSLTGRMVPTGDDTFAGTGIRTLPLDDGRVALVTDDGVDFLEL